MDGDAIVLGSANHELKGRIGVALVTRVYFQDFCSHFMLVIQEVC